MQVLYIVSVWLHILAVTAWMGGMFFLVLVIVPWLRQGNRVAGGVFLRETGERFRTVGWVCFGIALVTGSFNLWMRGVRFADFGSSEWLTSPFGKTVLVKLGLFLGVLIVSGIHDFFVGPQAAEAITRDADSPEALQLRRRASVLGRINVVLALALVAVGVMLVRGTPW